MFDVNQKLQSSPRRTETDSQSERAKESDKESE